MTPGNVANGYILNFDAYVAGPVVTTGIATVTAESQFQVKQNYPNPAIDQTVIPFVLRQSSDVKIEISDLQGKKIKMISLDNLSPGEQQATLYVSDFTAGRYVYSVEISNGTFKQAKLFVKN